MATATTMASNDDGVTGDFKGKQFDKEEVADKVVEQYDLKQARVFYKYVMVRGQCGGDGRFPVRREVVPFDHSRNT